MWVVVVGIVPLIIGVVKGASKFYSIETQAKLKGLQIGFYFGIGVALICMAFMDIGVAISIGLLAFGFSSMHYQKKFEKLIEESKKEK